MLIRRVTAPTRQEAYDKLRKELGPDVEIIHAAPHRRGGWWFWRKEWFEVVGVRSDASATDGNLKAHPTVKAALELSSSGMAEIPQGALNAGQSSPALLSAAPLVAALPATGELEDLKRQVGTLTSVVTELANVLKKNAIPPVAAIVTSPIADPDSPAALPQVPTILVHPASGPSRDVQYVDAAMATLRKQELTDELVFEARRYLLEALSERDLMQPKVIRERTIEYLASRLPACRGIDIVPGEKGKIVALVGPTGVGKTTTLAKLAGGLMFNQKLDVAFITIDTYRIAAPEQLKKYADIVEIPVKVVFNPEEMKDLVHGFRQKDVILIDTVGRSPRSREDLLDLRKFLDFGMPVETHLLTSAVTKLSDLRSIAAAFKEINYQKLLVSKTDETSSFGPVISIAAENRCGVSYLTTGQVVPDDILEATPHRLASLAFNRRGLSAESPPPRPLPEGDSEPVSAA